MPNKVQHHNVDLKNNNPITMAKLEYEILNVNTNDIRNVINLFLNQLQANSQYNLCLKITQNNQ